MTGGLFQLLFLIPAMGLALSACSGGGSYDYAGGHAGYGGGGVYKVGNPYKIAGRWYHPAVDPDYDKVGIASWYGPKFHGRPTANGERFNMNALTAAHTTLPMPSWVRVTNLENGRSIILRVNDRGPFVGNRIIDVSRRGAQLLGFEKQGTVRVRVQVVPGPDAPTPVQMAAAARQQTSPPRPAAPARETRIIPKPAEPAPEMAAVPPPAVEASAIAAPAAPVTVASRDHDPGPRWLSPEAAPGERVYIQAGAFSAYKSARRVAEGLEDLGRVELSPLARGNDYIYRVRIGPLASVGEADGLLGHVHALGHDAARIVVD